MEHIKVFEEFLNEGFTKLADLENAIRHHEDGNPYYDRTKLINIYNGLKSSDQTKAKNKWSDIFGVAEAQVNEASMSLTKYYKDYDKEIKNVAKEIDDIINSATFINPMAKDKLLDLITDLVEEYYFNKS